jgi:hypothetical protein
MFIPSKLIPPLESEKRLRPESLEDEPKRSEVIGH